MRARQRARARPRAGAGQLPPGRGRQRRAAARDLRARRGVVPHVRAPRRSCRRCGSRAITRAARTWSASAAPTTAGGATCSPASATRRPRARPTRSRTWTKTRCACCATRKDIACVLVNPLQAMHPNANAPSDSTLVDSGRGARFDREAYTAWLERLREVCTERGIVLIFDEVFVGFRLARGRRAGVLRRPRRHGHLRQDAGRRAAHRRAVRPQASSCGASATTAPPTSASRAARSTRTPT